MKQVLDGYFPPMRASIIENGKEEIEIEQYFNLKVNVANRHFNTWLTSFYGSIADYGYMIDTDLFEDYTDN